MSNFRSAGVVSIETVLKIISRLFTCSTTIILVVEKGPKDRKCYQKTASFQVVLRGEKAPGGPLFGLDTNVC